MMRAIVMIAAAALAGCSDPPAGDLDAGIDATTSQGPCWPTLNRVPQGSATLGTGRESFEAMPEVLPLEYGTQDGYNLVAHVRMSGFAPGNVADIFDVRNPLTRIRAYFDETNVPLNFYAHCPFRNAYVPTDAGDYELVEAVPIIFETCWRSDNLFGQRIRIELEIMDRAGGYATDVKVVTAAPPTSFYPVDVGSPGCTHRFQPGPAEQHP